MQPSSQKERAASSFHTRSPGSRWECKLSRLPCLRNIIATQYASSEADTCLSLAADTMLSPSFMTRRQTSHGFPWAGWMWRGSSIPASAFQTKSMSSAASATGKRSTASKSRRCQAMTRHTGPGVPGHRSYWRKVWWSLDTTQASLFFQTAICWLLEETQFTMSAVKSWSLIRRKGPSSRQLEQMRVRSYQPTTRAYWRREI